MQELTVLLDLPGTFLVSDGNPPSFHANPTATSDQIRTCSLPFLARLRLFECLFVTHGRHCRPEESEAYRRSWRVLPGRLPLRFATLIMAFFGQAFVSLCAGLRPVPIILTWRCPGFAPQ